MTQTTNNENDHGYAWARRPGTSTDHTAPAPAADATSEFAATGGPRPTDQQPPSAPPGWPQGHQAPPSAATGPVPSYTGSYGGPKSR